MKNEMTRATKPALLSLLMLVCAAGPAFARGELLVGNKSDDTVWRLSLDDGRKLGEVATGNGPHEIAVDAVRGVVIVTNYGHDQAGSTLTVIDAVSGLVKNTIDLGEHGRPHGVRLLPDGSSMLVTAEQSGSLLLVDLQSGDTVRTFDVGAGGGHMVALSRDGRTAFVSKIVSGQLVRVDLASGNTREKPAGQGAEGVEVHADGSVWVSNREDDTVTVHDPDTLAIRHTLKSTGFPIRVAFTTDDRHALVTNAKAGTLAVFDARTRERVATVALADKDGEYQNTMLGKAALPIGVVADPSASRVYGAISGGNTIAVVDSDSWQVIDRWQTGTQPDALGIVIAPSKK